MSKKSTETNIEEVKATRSEKLLATVLVVFLCIGSFWTYSQLETVSNRASEQEQNALFESQTNNPAITKHEDAQQRVQTAEDQLQRTKEQLELRRETYRTAIEAKQPNKKLKQEYEQSQINYRAKNLQVRGAKQEEREAAPAAKVAEKKLEKKDHRLQKLADEDSRNTFLLRLAFIIFTSVFSLWFLGHVRKQRPKFLSLAIALVATTSIQALVMAWEYLGEYVQLQKAGPIVISLIGSSATILAFISLQRYLAKRTPLRRVRKHECSFCGFPLKGNQFCEGCGRQAFCECSTCHQKRRVGSAHCMSCGTT